MRVALVFGGSGQIGAALITRLVANGWRVFAVSRHAQPDRPGVQWLRGDLDHVDALPASVSAIFSCGPLDHFARWYASTAIDVPRAVAFGSTSVDIKKDSVDTQERDVAARLAEGERSVFATAAARGAGATVLRPTLVYGVGRDQTLTRIVAFARRRGLFILPRHATGLRQPVHVDDLATAALHASDAPATHGRAYAVPGGEALSYRDMVVRVLATQQPTPRVVELPGPLFRVALAAARLCGQVGGFGDAALARLQQDLVFDSGPAWRDFGYQPRAFRPTAEMFTTR
jgi:nucleoside-diphosphate-sugar epimerase